MFGEPKGSHYVVLKNALAAEFAEIAETFEVLRILRAQRPILKRAYGWINAGRTAPPGVGGMRPVL